MEQVALKLAVQMPEFPKLPPVSSLFQVDDPTLYQLYPVAEVKYHNMENPHLCNCSPTYTLYPNEEDLVDLAIVEHHWLV